MRIELSGIPVPKKNSRNLFKRGGKIFNIPSSRYKSWHRVAAFEIINQIDSVIPILDVEKISIEFHMPDNRRRDLTNIAESVMDLLVDAEVIKDDCWQIVPIVALESKGICKVNPRTIIIIKEE